MNKFWCSLFLKYLPIYQNNDIILFTNFIVHKQFVQILIMVNKR